MASKPGRKPNSGDTVPFRVTVPKALYEYLGYLAKRSHIGASEGDVASYLLRERVTELLQAKFHELEIPRDAPSDKKRT